MSCRTSGLLPSRLPKSSGEEPYQTLLEATYHDLSSFSYVEPRLTGAVNEE